LTNRMVGINAIGTN